MANKQMDESVQDLWSTHQIQVIGSLTVYTLYLIISIDLVLNGHHHGGHEEDPILIVSCYQVVCWPAQMVFFHFSWLLYC